MTKPTHQNALPLGSLLMEYRLVSVLGAGGFGITYLAHDTNLEKDVAIKEYLPGVVAVRGSEGTVLPTSTGLEHDYRWGLDRFIQEARTLAKFSHPNIVRVNRFFETNGTGYMVMDYEAGEPLKAWLQRNPFPPEPTLRGMLAPLLDGLEKVHAAGFLHRDIKPDNIYIRKDGSPVLIDFGSARQAVGGATQALTTIVSPGYAPFEQYTTSAEQGPWSDIYSLSGVVYFAATGQSPPDAITRMKSDPLAQGLGGARVRYSAPFVDAIAWGLALEEAARPRNIAQWREVLFGQRGMTPQTPAPGGPGTPAPAKMVPAPRTGQPGKPTASSRPEGADRARSAVAPAHPIPRDQPRPLETGMIPWKTLAVAAVLIAVVGIALRSMKLEQPARPAQRPGVVVLYARDLVGPNASPTGPIPVPQQAQPSPPAEASVAPVASEPQAENIQPAPAPPSAQGSVPVAASKPVAEPPGTDATTRVMPPGLERRLEARFQQADLDGLGLTRSELAKAFPRLAGRFDQLDTDHDGRVEAGELLVAWHQMTPQQRESQ